MADENETGDELSPEATAYFESRGEAQPKEEPEVVEQKPEPAPKAETGEPEKEKADPQVPLRALTKEREENKRNRQELDEFRRKTTLLEDRLNQILAFQQPEPQKQEPPDPDKDIFAAMRWQTEQVQAMQQAERQRAAQVAQQSHEAQVEQAIWRHWASETEAFSKEVSDFGDARKFLAELRDGQLAAFASLDQRFATREGRDEQINAELKQVILSAHQASMSPARAVYDLAKAYGYKGPAPRADDPAKAVEKLANAVEKEMTLSSTDGGAAKTVKSAEDVAAMTGPEFEAWLQKAGEKGFKRLMQQAG